MKTKILVVPKKKIKVLVVPKKKIPIEVKRYRDKQPIIRKTRYV